jgi:valyl-tRNA synthetase
MKATESINDSFTNYKFGDAQQNSYAMWMDDVCDVYLELIKPVVYDTSDANKDSRWAAQATLWVTLEAGLRLLHPMMPFVTEELWQRLPGRGTLGDDEPQSIMIASYPEAVGSYKNDEAEASMNSTMAAVRACRSLRASYNIPLKTLTHFFIKISGPGESHVTDQIDDIKTLGKASAVDINKPESEVVGTVIVDDTLTVMMDVKGLVDYKVEIGRLQKNLKTTVPLIEQLEKKMSTEGYEVNVPDDLKAANKEKLEALQKKKTDLEEAITNLEKLELLDKK